MGAHRAFEDEREPEVTQAADPDQPEAEGEDAETEVFRPRLQRPFRPGRAGAVGPGLGMLNGVLRAIKERNFDEARKIAEKMGDVSRGAIQSKQFALGLLEAHADNAVKSMKHFEMACMDRSGQPNDKLLTSFLTANRLLAREFAFALRRNEENLKAQGLEVSEFFKPFIVPPVPRRG